MANACAYISAFIGLSVLYSEDDKRRQNVGHQSLAKGIVKLPFLKETLMLGFEVFVT